MGWILCAPLISEMVHHKDGVVGPHPAVICFGRSWLDSWSEFFFSYLFLKKNHKWLSAIIGRYGHGRRASSLQS